MAKTRTTRQQLRASFLWLHRWLGLLSGIVVFIVAITGCIYVFEEELRDVFQHKYLYVDVPAGKPRQPLADISQVVRKNYPNEKINQVRFKSAANTTVVYYTQSEKAISVNPYTLQVTGVRNTKNDFFAWILDMHRHLRWGETGGAIIKWNVLIFFIMCISGLVLWWPKQKRFFKQAVTIKFKTKNRKRLNWDLHSVLGFYALLILFIISLTGMFWMFDWVKDATRFVTQSPKAKEKKIKSKPVADSAGLFPLEEAITIAAAKYPGAEQTIAIANLKDSTAPIRIRLRYPYTLVRNENTVYFDKYSGAILREDLLKNYTAYDKVARSNYQLHTGNIPALGIGSKIIYFLASLFAASLPVTGFIIWLGRKKKNQKKKSSHQKAAQAIKEPVATLAPVS